MHYHLHRRHLHRHLHRYRHSPVTFLIIVDIFRGFGVAAFLSILALYLNSYGLSESIIGFITGSLTIVILLASLVAVSLLERFRKRRLLLISSLLVAAGYILAALTTPLVLFLFILIIITFSETIFFATFQILFRDASKKSEYSSNIGIMYALESIGWIVSPFLAGIILERFGFSWVFIGVALFPLLAIPLIIKTRTKDVPHTTLHRSVFSLKSNFFDFLSEKRLHLPYIFSASIGFWWNFLYIYPPLFLVNSGYSEFWVGIFIGAINIPTLFFEYLAGKQITYHHFRTFFLIGYCLLAFFAILCFLISSLPIILILLVLASIPLSYVEPIQPAYFFSLVKRKDEERYYPVFDTSFDMGSMIGKFLPALILLFLPASFTFLAVGLCMLALAGLSLKVHR